MVVKARLVYARLAKELAARGDREMAASVIDRCMEVLPPDRFPYDPYFPELIEAALKAGASDKAEEMTRAFTAYYYARLDYFLKQKPYIISSAEYEIQSAIQYVSKVAGFCIENGQPALGAEIQERIGKYFSDYSSAEGIGIE